MKSDMDPLLAELNKQLAELAKFEKFDTSE